MTGAFLVASGALIGGMLFDVARPSRPDDTPLASHDARGAIVASYQPEPFAVPHSGLDVIWNHFQR
ncbi:hypothetical protein [Azoarcus sp. KH32C]|uniref:hypothetical protein n=1 Tax=Azoarcus sp. KH32C TaxID=748247 RepID=UPI000346A9FE|nr:hypothetical protein [Azoarcus sp. KH32C]